jgi:carbamoyltransferase
MSKIIGINYASHDTSVCLLVDGNIECILEQEKMEGIKSCHNLYAHPKSSLDYIEKKYGVNFETADHIVFSMPYVKDFVKNMDGKYRDKISSYSHHKCHAIGSYLTSGMEGKVISLSHDGKGYRSRGKLFLCEDGNFEEIHSQSISVTGSLAGLWAASTFYLGWTMLKDEGKVVGLAGHGEFNPRFYEIMKKCIWYDGNFNFKPANWENLWHYSFSNRLRREGIFENRKSREDFAYTLEIFTEELLSEYLRDVSTKYPDYRKICFSGGLFANVKLNKFINDLDLFDEIYVHPAMGDSGLSLGAALCKAYDLGEISSPIKMPNAFYGQFHSKEEWDSEILLHGEKLKVEKFSLERIGTLIDEGYVVGTFIGKTEYGPRALGNRSIIVKPTDPETHEKLNKKLKRTEIMPFAPSILEEYSSEVFECKKSKYTSEFMTLCYDTNPKWVDLIPAVVHQIDKTARPQIVSRENNNSFYSIIDAYRKISGIPLVLNTSFNAHGEPINNYPNQVIKHLFDSCVDYLVTEDYIISKNSDNTKSKG